MRDPENTPIAVQDGPVETLVEEIVVTPDSPAAQLIDEEIVREFLTRQVEVLEYIENLVLDIETNQTDADLPDLMRLFHTLKGESALLGFGDVSRLAHCTEDMLQREPLGDCVDRILDVKDWLQVAIERLAGEEGEAPAPVDELITRLERTGAPDAATAATDIGEIPEAAPPAPGSEMDGVYALNIRDLDVDMLQDFIAEAGEHLEATEAHLLELENDPSDAEAFNAVFRCFHTIKGVAGFVEMEHIKELAHKAENLLSMVRKGELELTGDAMDLAFASVDMLKHLNDDVGEGMAGDGSLARRPELSALMERLVAACDGGPVSAPEPAPAAAAAADMDDNKSGLVILPKARKSAPAEPEARSGLVILPKARKTEAPRPAAPDETATASATKARANPVQRHEAVRVDAERLDLMVETIGELVIAEAMVSQNQDLRSTNSVDLLRHLDHLDKICRELQQIGLSLRMVPVRPIFQKMARLVRDLSKKSGRKVEFVMAGEDTELDKSVVDKIGDPLVHMLRNAVDHGIESDPQERVAGGKPPEGYIHLRAFHKGGSIVIEVEDDGRGLDRKAILAKAVERGLIHENAVLGDREIFNLIFEPGFSTAKTVTDVSGRGVGMDVVRRNIEALRGSVDIASTPGRGSVISIRLPLTLAIIEGMVFSAGAERYIVPTLNVLRLIRPRPDDYATVMDKSEMLRFEDGIIPLIRLHEVFDVAGARKNMDEGVVIVAESEGRRIGLLADDLIGQQQIVIKSLGDQVQRTEGLAGGAIMSDGNVALILDVDGLVKVAHEDKHAELEEAGGRS